MITYQGNIVIINMVLASQDNDPNYEKFIEYLKEVDVNKKHHIVINLENFSPNSLWVGVLATFAKNKVAIIHCINTNPLLLNILRISKTEEFINIFINIKEAQEKLEGIDLLPR